MDIVIRKAETTDAPALAELLRSLRIFSRINAEDATATEERVMRHLALATADDSHLILVAQTSEKNIVGYGAVHWLPYLILTGPEGYVSELFIAEEFRGQGIGGQLLATMQANAEKRGCSRMLLLNFRDRESYQREFYSKQGWNERPDAANFVLPLNPLS